jgi:hypothetical protein
MVNIGDSTHTDYPVTGCLCAASTHNPITNTHTHGETNNTYGDNTRCHHTRNHNAPSHNRRTNA